MEARNRIEAALRHIALVARAEREIEIAQGPTREERQARCEQMGLVFCSCQLDKGQVVVYHPNCPVHQAFCKL